MAKKRICPLIQKECLKENCMWWVRLVEDKHKKEQCIVYIMTDILLHQQ